MAWRHGTIYGYRRKRCRCEHCVAANSRKRRLARDRARAENRPSYQHDLAVSRALKESYRGVCTECGAPTTGCDGPGSAPDLCFRCAPKLVGLKKRGQGPTVGRLLALLDAGDVRFSELSEALDISPGHVSNLMNRLVNYGLIERVDRGVYRKVAA